MPRSEIMLRLKGIMCDAGAIDKSRADSIGEDTKLAEELGLTSVGMLFTVIAIEETFSIRFDSVGMADFTTVRNVVDYIEEAVK